MKYEVWLCHPESETYIKLSTHPSREGAESFVGAQPNLDGYESYKIKEVKGPGKALEE